MMHFSDAPTLDLKNIALERSYKSSITKLGTSEIGQFMMQMQIWECWAYRGKIEKTEKAFLFCRPHFLMVHPTCSSGQLLNFGCQSSFVNFGNTKNSYLIDVLCMFVGNFPALNSMLASTYKVLFKSHH